MLFKKLLLNELLGLKWMRDKTPRSIRNFLKNELGGNYKFLGNGVFAAAITDGKKAFKFWLYDSAYEQYIDFCLDNQTNPHVPKFYSRPKVFPRLVYDYDVHYIKMELLQPPPQYVTIDTNDAKISLDDFLACIETSSKDRALANLARKLPNFDLTNITSEVNNLIELIVALVTKFGKGSMDLHNGNIMQRADGTLVIIDPLYSSDELFNNKEIFGDEEEDEFDEDEFINNS